MPGEVPFSHTRSERLWNAIKKRWRLLSGLGAAIVVVVGLIAKGPDVLEFFTGYRSLPELAAARDLTPTETVTTHSPSASGISPGTATEPHPVSTDAPEPTPTTPSPTRQFVPALPVGLGTPVPVPEATLSNYVACELAHWEWAPSEWEPTGRERDDFSTVVDFGPSESTITLAAGSRNGTIAIYVLSSGDLNFAPFPAHSDRVVGLAYSRSGSYLYSTSVDRELKKWKLTSTAISNLEAHERYSDRPLAMAYSHDLIAIGFDGDGLMLTPLGDITQGRYLPGAHAALIWSVALAPDSGLLISGGADSYAYVWQIENGAIVRDRDLHEAPPIQTGGIVLSVAATTYNGRPLFATGSLSGDLYLHQLPELPDDRRLTSFGPFGAESPIWALAFCSDGSLLAAGTQGGEVLLFQTAELLHPDLPVQSERIDVAGTFGTDNPTTRINSLEFGPRDLYMAVGAAKGISVWGACPSPSY